MTTDGVLLVGHGTVADLDDMPEFLRRIRRGRPPSDDLVDEMKRRYRAVGGSPLLAITHAQADALSEALGLPVLVAMRLWHPFIEDVLARAVDDGLGRLCVLPVAPFSVHVYCDATAEALARLAESRQGGPPITLVRAEPYGTRPELCEASARRIAPELPRGAQQECELILTAHSLPVSVIEAGDPYQRDFEACARAVAERLGRPATIAYQSQGAGGGEWLGPDLATVLEDAASRGVRRVVVAPIGFVADHIETLYDLDIEARAVAEGLGLDFTRVPAMNTDPAFIEVLASTARRALSSRNQAG